MLVVQVGLVNNAVERSDDGNNGSRQNHASFKPGRQEFDLAVAVRVVLIGGAMGEIERIEREHGCRDVGDRVQGIGKDDR